MHAKPLSVSGAMDRRGRPQREAVLQRVRAEFQEMPCMRLTLAQANRLFGLPPDVCRRVLGELLHDGSVMCGSDGLYRLNDGSTWPTRTKLFTPALV